MRNPWDRENDISILETYNILTGEREVLKEFPYLIEAPNWTPDGKSLVYNSRGRIWVFDLDTAVSREVDTGFADRCNNDHVLSPDGKSIAISHGAAEDGKSRVYTVSLKGGEPRLITPQGPSYLHGWSPDGKNLAYCAERDGEYDIYTMPAEGGAETRLTDEKGLNDGPEYDAAGRIWFNSIRSGLMQAYRMNADGTDQRQMTFDEDSNTWFPHVSPDGKWVSLLAYKKGDLEPGEHLPHKNVEIRLMPGEGGSVQTIVRLFGGQGTMNVNSWSPCSTKFAFVSYRLPDEDNA